MQELFEKYKIVKSEFLNKGWSSDKKIILHTQNGERLLLRISDGKLYEKKKAQFELLQKLKTFNVNCSKAIDFGILSSGEVFMLLTWISGESAEEVLPLLSDKQAYDLGIESAKTLKCLHGVKVDMPNESWWQKYSVKIPKKIENLKGCGLSFEGQEGAISFLLDNMYLVKDRKQAFSHADYHVGNMIVSDGKIAVIDFDKNTIADPYDDFKPFCWNVFASEYFQTGLINGYFEGEPPKEFFKILALYASESIISHLPWAIKFGEKEIRTSYKVINSVLLWYDNFNLTIPTWYKGASPLKEKK